MVLHLHHVDQQALQTEQERIPEPDDNQNKQTEAVQFLLHRLNFFVWPKLGLVYRAYSAFRPNGVNGILLLELSDGIEHTDENCQENTSCGNARRRPGQTEGTSDIQPADKASAGNAQRNAPERALEAVLQALKGNHVAPFHLVSQKIKISGFFVIEKGFEGVIIRGGDSQLLESRTPAPEWRG